MSWQEYQNNDRLEQEQLEIIRALIEDATKDTVLWLQADPSAEERAHVLAIQERLAGLARIIERRMERRKETKDEWEYSETVSEVLLRLDKARKLRGNIIVGKGLGRLTERLPQELPGAKVRSVSQAPAPPHDWHEELRRARNMEDDFSLLTFGHARDAVRMLAQANDPIDQEKRIDSLWRMYPEAAKQLGLPKLPASSLSQVKPAAPSSVESQANRWRAFRNEFERLAREEERIERAAPKDRLLHAYCTYRERPEVWEKGKPEQGCFCLLKAPETGLWTLGDGVSENFLERFRALAARAGVTLGSPEGADPEDLWLHRLYLDLLENKSKQLFAASKEGGVILRVCEASATFCARLERKALETNGAEKRSKAIVEVEEQRTYARLERNKPITGLSATVVAGSFTHSEDYRSVTIRGKTHTLTTGQAQMIEVLHEALKNGTPDISAAYIMERRGTPNSRWQDTWKANREALKALIENGATKGTLRLKL